MKKVIYTKDAPEPIGPYSQAVLVNEILYISGQIALDPNSNVPIDGNIKSQAKQVMENLKAILNEAEMNFKNIVKANIYLTDIDDFQAVNEVYKSYFGDSPPAREVVEASKLPKNSNIEISGIAVRNN